MQAIVVEPGDPLDDRQLGLPGLRPCTPTGVIGDAGTYRRRPGWEIGRGPRPLEPLRQADGPDVHGSRCDSLPLCHSRTPDLPATCRACEILVAAVGRPEMVRAHWVLPGATVIDVGINRRSDSLVGDVAFDEVAEVAGAISPVPGGVGPLTIACLLAQHARSRGGSDIEDCRPLVTRSSDV